MTECYTPRNARKRKCPGSSGWTISGQGMSGATPCAAAWAGSERIPGWLPASMPWASRTAAQRSSSTSSYRLSFDLLRRDREDLDCWILVLDTRGLGVGSAAAAGLFSTDELVTRINASRLARAGQSSERSSFRRAERPRLTRRLLARATGFEVRIDRVGGRRPGPLRPHRSVPEATGPRITFLALTPVELGRSLMLFPGFAFAAFSLRGPGAGGSERLTGHLPAPGRSSSSALPASSAVPWSHRCCPPCFRGFRCGSSGGAAGLAATAALLEAAVAFGGPVGAAWESSWRQAAGCSFPAASALSGGTVCTGAAWPRQAARREGHPFSSPLAALAALLTLAALVLAKVSQW